MHLHNLFNDNKKYIIGYLEQLNRIPPARLYCITLLLVN